MDQILNGANYPVVPAPPVDIPCPPNMQIVRNRRRPGGPARAEGAGGGGDAVECGGVLRGVASTDRVGRPVGKHVGPMTARNFATTDEGSWLPHTKQFPAHTARGEGASAHEAVKGRKIFPEHCVECTDEWRMQRRQRVQDAFKPSAEFPELGRNRKHRTEPPVSVADRRDRVQKAVDYKETLQRVAEGGAGGGTQGVVGGGGLGVVDTECHGAPPLFPRRRAGEEGTQHAVLKWARDGGKLEEKRLQQMSVQTRDNVKGVLRHDHNVASRPIPRALAQQAAPQPPYVYNEASITGLVPSKNITGSFPQPKVPRREGVLSENRLRFLKEKGTGRKAWH